MLDVQVIGYGCENALMETADGSPRPGGSAGSLLSIGSSGSIVSIGSAGFDLVHRLCGFDPLDWLGRLGGVGFFDRFGSQGRLGLVRAFPLVCAGMAVSRHHWDRPPPGS